MKRLVLYTSLATFAAFGAITACSSSSDSGGVVNEFSTLPEVTGPVTTNGSLNVGASLATTGVLLSSPGTFGGGTSRQFCENVNLLKEILREASQPDKIMCYMGAMRRSNVIPASLNLTDGNVKYIRLINLPNGHTVSQIRTTSRNNEQPLVKVQMVKTAGAISSFKMWSCFGGSVSVPEQSEYISQTFSGGTATVVSKYLGGENTATYGSSMTATGAFDTTWTSKNITGFRYYDDSPSLNVMEINMDQFANLVRFSMAMNGRFGSDTFINRFYTVAQLLGDTLSEIAIGSGSSKSNMSYDQDTDGVDFTDAATYSWDGDTRMNLGTASDGDFFATADAGSVPAAPNTAQTVTFTGDEAWDCSLPTGETWTDANFSSGGAGIVTGMQACDDKYLGDGGGWLNCPY